MDAAPRHQPTRLRHVRFLSLATIFAAASGFLVLWVAARALDVDAFADFQAFWGLFFALTGFLDGIMQETTRSVAAARERRTSVATTTAWPIAGLLGVVAATLALVAGILWMNPIVPTRPGSATTLLAAGLLSYAFQAVLSGVLSGLGLWPRYAALVALDSGVRFAGAVVAWMAGAGIGVYLLITVIGALSWLFILGTDPQRTSHLRAPLDVSARAFLRRTLSAMAGTGASAVLITGFPVLVKVAEPGGAHGGAVAAIILAVTLTRAPILVPVQRFQSALIVRCVEHRDALWAALRLPIALTYGAGLAGGAAAWVLGPWILGTFFGEELVVAGPVLAVLTFASAATGTLFITGAAALAADRHGHYVTGWAVASTVAFAVLFIPAPLEVAVCAALIAGPAAGVLVHAVAMRRPRAALLD
ncbi:hypothetical membrane protein [Corynebacterium renale]|uniref:O-antigen/teichoic acid export membrane protein n=1 Tax=Corynebacterium renale TaxID=1724 RepID=A0A2A9DL98_9CORY|nr:O-antigen/teichoic acid export membrane protein [Corynebacterium renale]SQI23540.1 hypothetical membrane protein [Corynebacterium renale]